ncbi:MAG: AAA family ATPase, partial [Myxococcota bacterium]
MRETRLSEAMALALLEAEILATSLNQTELRSTHVLAGMLKHCPKDFAQALEQAMLSPQQLLSTLIPASISTPKTLAELFPSPATLRCIQRARQRARAQSSPEVTHLHVFYSILEDPSLDATSFLQQHGLKSSTLDATSFLQQHGLKSSTLGATSFLQQHKLKPSTVALSPSQHLVPSHEHNAQRHTHIKNRTRRNTSPINPMPGELSPMETNPPSQEHTALFPPNEFGVDLVAQAHTFAPVIGREKELRWMLQILCRRHKNHPLLIGPPGVGKTSMLHALAQRIAEHDVPTPLKHSGLFVLDLGATLAGAKYRGDFEQRLRSILQYIVNQPHRTLLVLPQVHNFLGAGGGRQGLDASRLLQPAIAQGRIQVIATTTPQEMRETLEKANAFLRLFQTLPIEEPSAEQTLSILRGRKAEYEEHHHVKIADQALRAAVKLSQRYLPERAWPDKALDLLDEAASRMRLSIESMPPELDQRRRRLQDLENERLALQQEQPTHLEGHREQVQDLEQLHAQLQAEFQQQLHTWEQEQRWMAEVRVQQELLQQHQEALLKAKQDADFEAAARIRIQHIEPLQQRQRESQQARTQQNKESGLKDSVDQRDVAQVIEDWTGIPTSSILQSEREKLRHLETQIA